MTHRPWTSLLLVALLCGCGRGVLTNPVPQPAVDGAADAPDQAGHDQTGPVEAGPDVARDAAADGEDRAGDLAPPPPDVASDVPPDVRPDVAPDVAPDAVTPEFTGELTRISVSPTGAEANGWSGKRDLGGGPMVSGDGRLVVFESEATNLVDDDTNGFTDVFIHDRASRQTRRLTVAYDGGNPDGPSETPSISVDGAHVAFRTAARNLGIGGIGTGRFQIVTWSAQSRSFAGQSNGATADCFNPVVSNANDLVVAFETPSPILVTDTNGITDVYFTHTWMRIPERASAPHDAPPAQANQGSHEAAISADGNLVAFHSDASNLVPGDTNDERDVFLRIRNTRQTIRVSTGPGGDQADSHSFSASISADGKRIAYGSSATNLVAGDRNNTADVFVFDRMTGKTVRASVASDGTEANGFSLQASLSGDGRLVAFTSLATNLVPGDVEFPGERDTPDVFVHDLVTRKTFRISVPLSEDFQPGYIGRVNISANGRVVVFTTDLPNLVPGDTSRVSDVFVYEFKTAPWL